jgi:hypothetical protein
MRIKEQQCSTYRNKDTYETYIKVACELCAHREAGPLRFGDFAQKGKQQDCHENHDIHDNQLKNQLVDWCDVVRNFEIFFFCVSVDHPMANDFNHTVHRTG